jgi:UrcA family protein
MNTNNLFAGFLPLATLSAGMILASSAAFADENSQVTVAAERPTVSTKHIHNGMPEEVVSITHKVSYSDLNLATRAGAMELETRIKDSAKAICARLDALDPQSKSENPNCTKSATDAAMTQAHAAIASAGKPLPKL